MPCIRLGTSLKYEDDFMCEHCIHKSRNQCNDPTHANPLHYSVHKEKEFTDTYSGHTI